MYVHCCEPLVLLALEVGIRSEAKECLRSDRSFVRLLNAVAEPPGNIVSGKVYSNK